jgi:hypothetical protein
MPTRGLTFDEWIAQTKTQIPVMGKLLDTVHIRTLCENAYLHGQREGWLAAGGKLAGAPRTHPKEKTIGGHGDELLESQP